MYQRRADLTYLNIDRMRKVKMAVKFRSFRYAFHIKRRLLQLDFEFLGRHDLDGKEDKLLGLRPHALRCMSL